MSYGYIYVITNTLNQMVYVGATTRPIESRWRSHIHNSRRGKYRSPIKDAIRDFGAENFTIQTVCEARNRRQLDVMERKYIAQYRSNDEQHGYNRQSGGKNGYKSHPRTVAVVVAHMKWSKRKRLSIEEHAERIRMCFADPKKAEQP
jgi:group I intron endonuclease